MKKISKLLLLPILVLLIVSCGDDDATTSIDEDMVGNFILKMDNVAGTQSAGLLSEIGAEEYSFNNVLGQAFNVFLLRYYVSKVSLSGPNGELWEEELLASADEVKGYYLIDESDLLSQTITLEKVPSGTYNSVTFTIGVEEEGVEQGAAGGVLSQDEGATDQDMFWNWTTGYLALKLEGQAQDSPGEASGEMVDSDIPNGISYHIGGWSDPNNNKEITLDFDPVNVADDLEPEVHVVFDILKLFGGINNIDFSITNNIHSPATGVEMAENIPGAFAVDHVHQ